MQKRKSFVGPVWVGLAVLALAVTAWAIKITLFMDTDTFIKRAQDIVIVEVTGVPDPDSRVQFEGLHPVDIEILMPLKGEKAIGKTTMATIYPVEKGKRYMVSSLGGSAFGTDLLAVPELSLVALPDSMELKGLAGKSVKEQVSSVFQARLVEVKTEQIRLADERLLLEKAVEPQQK